LAENPATFTPLLHLMHEEETNSGLLVFFSKALSCCYERNPVKSSMILLACDDERYVQVNK